MKRAATILSLLLVTAACGGGDGTDISTQSGEGDSGGDAATSGVFVASSDGIVTVEVPAGAAPEGVTVTVDAGDPESLPQQLLDTGLPVFVYELGPDGTQFAEPVTVTFRIPAALAEFDPAVGMPLAVLASRLGDGLLDLYGSVDVSVDGDVLVVSGSTDHFSEAVVILGVELSLVTLPSPVKVGVGQIFHALVSNILDYEKAAEEGYQKSYRDFQGVNVLYKSDAPITMLNPIVDGVDERLAAAGGVGEFRCDDETEGVQPDAITAELRVTFREFREPLEDLDGLWFLIGVHLFANAANAELVATFHADVECTEEEEAATSTTTTESPSGGSDPQDDQEKDSEKVKPGDGEGGGDIKNVRHELGPSGENCFIIDFYGDGKTLTAEASSYLVKIEAADSAGGGFGFEVRFRNGTPEPGTVSLGPNGPGRDRLEGAIVTLVWENSDTLRACVDSGETDLPAAATFEVLIGVFTTDGTFFDNAMGVAGS